jgi:hypothetical protein
MYVKNANVFERHVEKMALGVGILFVLAVVYLFVWDQPWQVQTGPGGGTGAASDGERAINNKLKELDANLKNPKSEVPTMDVADFHAILVTELNKPVSPENKFQVALGDAGVFIPAQNVVNLPDLPERPPVALVAAAAWWAVLAPEAANQFPKLGEKNPPDFPYVSVSGYFDAPQWDRLLDDAKVPEDWKLDRHGICDVILKRQTLDPVSGAWGPWEEIGLLPNAPLAPMSLREHPIFKGSVDQATDLLRKIGAAQFTICCAPFAPITGVPCWVPPEFLAPPKDGAVQQFDRKVIDVERKIKSIQEQVNAAEAGGAAAAPGAEPPAPPPPAPPAPPAAPGPEGAPAPDAAAGGAAAPLQVELTKWLDEWFTMFPPVRLLAQGPAPVRVVAHDLTVQPGKTYRYQMIVSVLNPYFERPERATDVPRKYRDRLGLETLPSKPSDPITVPEATQVYLTNVTEDRATFAVVRVFNGKWEQGQYRIGRGQVVSGSVTISGAKQPFDKGEVIVDLRPAPLGGEQRVVVLDAANRLVDRTAADGKKQLDRFQDEASAVAAVPAPGNAAPGAPAPGAPPAGPGGPPGPGAPPGASAGPSGLGPQSGAPAPAHQP